jgi:hypothetical protein
VIVIPAQAGIIVCALTQLNAALCSYQHVTEVLVKWLDIDHVNGSA